MLATEVVLCEDGHAQERSLLGQVLPCVEPDDLWIADRNFCTVAFLSGIAARGGCFVVRQHGQLTGSLVGVRQSKGAIDTGKVYEQKIGLVNAQGDTVLLRRITVALHEPTRDGDTEIHVLSNVPMRKVSAQKLAESYGKRWTIETIEFISLSFWYDAPLRSQDSDRRHDSWLVYGSPICSLAPQSSWI